MPVDDTRTTTTSLFPVQTITFVYPHLIAGLYERWRIPPTIHSCIFRHRLTLASRYVDIFNVTQSQPVPPSKRRAPSRRPVFLLGLTGSCRLTGCSNHPLHPCFAIAVDSPLSRLEESLVNKARINWHFSASFLLTVFSRVSPRTGRIFASQPLSRRICRVIRRNLTLECWSNSKFPSFYSDSAHWREIIWWKLWKRERKREVWHKVGHFSRKYQIIFIEVPR